MTRSHLHEVALRAAAKGQATVANRGSSGKGWAATTAWTLAVDASSQTRLRVLLVHGKRATRARRADPFSSCKNTGMMFGHHAATAVAHVLQARRRRVHELELFHIVQTLRQLLATASLRSAEGRFGFRLRSCGEKLANGGRVGARQGSNVEFATR